MTFAPDANGAEPLVEVVGRAELAKRVATSRTGVFSTGLGVVALSTWALLIARLGRKDLFFIGSECPARVQRRQVKYRRQ